MSRGSARWSRTEKKELKIVYRDVFAQAAHGADKEKKALTRLGDDRTVAFCIAEADLKHKILAIVEEEGAERESYALKLLQSEGDLTIASTGKDPATGRLVTQEYRVEGPLMIFQTTAVTPSGGTLLGTAPRPSPRWAARLRLASPQPRSQCVAAPTSRRRGRNQKKRDKMHDMQGSAAQPVAVASILLLAARSDEITLEAVTGLCDVADSSEYQDGLQRGLTPQQAYRTFPLKSRGGQFREPPNCFSKPMGFPS